MRTLTIPLNAASPHARLVLADMATGVALWLSEPDTQRVREQLVHRGFIGRRHAAELGEFLLRCPVPDYEPDPGRDRATWLAHVTAGPALPHLHEVDLRLNRGRADARDGQPQGLLRFVTRAASPLLLTVLNVPLLAAGQDPGGEHPTGAEIHLGNVHRLGGRLTGLATSAA